MQLDITVTDETIAALCARHPLALPVLEQLGIAIMDPGTTIDACCGTRGLLRTDLDHAVSAAEAACASAWGNQPLETLIDGIVRAFHRPFPIEIDEVRRAFEVARDATTHAPWAAVIDELAELHADLAHHIEMEERVVFPWLRAQNLGATSTIRAMQLEHGDAIAQLLAIEAHASGCAAGDPTNTKGAHALATLHRFERWLCEHIHIESNALFPRALEAELARR